MSARKASIAFSTRSRDISAPTWVSPPPTMTSLRTGREQPGRVLKSTRLHDKGVGTPFRERVQSEGGMSEAPAATTYMAVMPSCSKRHRAAVFTRHVLQHHAPVRLHRLRRLSSANPDRAHAGDRAARPAMHLTCASSRPAPAALGPAARLQPSHRARALLLPVGNRWGSAMRLRDVMQTGLRRSFRSAPAQPPRQAHSPLTRSESGKRPCVIQHTASSGFSPRLIGVAVPQPVAHVDCPACRSAGAMLAFENPWRRVFFCLDCRHLWSVPLRNPSTPSGPPHGTSTGPAGPREPPDAVRGNRLPRRQKD